MFIYEVYFISIFNKTKLLKLRTVANCDFLNLEKSEQSSSTKLQLPELPVLTLKKVFYRKHHRM